MTDLKKVIIERLTCEDAIHRRKLRDYLFLNGFALSDRELRLTIADLIETDGYLITSSSKGYKLCTTVKEYEKALAYITSYAMSLLKKRRAMKRNFVRLVKPQLF